MPTVLMASADTTQWPIDLPRNFSWEQADQWLQGQLSKKRYNHSFGVVERTSELAEKFNLSPPESEQARVAGLLHDAAKLLSPDELLAYADTAGVELSDADRRSPRTLHPIIGAAMVKREFSLLDGPILNAIRYHTTARAGMGLVEKIVYVADKTERRTRDPEFIQEIDDILDGDGLYPLNQAMIAIIDDALQEVIQRGDIIHPRTIAARNDLISQNQDGVVPSSVV